MSTSHLYSLRVEKRRERLEWLGDIVLEEIIVRLIARQALSALDWEQEEEGERENKAKERAEMEKEVGSGRGEVAAAAAASAGSAAERTGTETETQTEGGFGVPEALRPLSWRLDFATRLVVSNANLREVYKEQLVGLMGFVGLEEDQFLLGLSGVGAGGAGGGGAGGGGGGDGGKRKRCRSSSFSFSGTGVAKKAKTNKSGKKDKRVVRCRSSSFGSAAADAAAGVSPPSATKVNKWDKRMPDMVEAAIGEAFEASLGLGGGGSGSGSRGGRRGRSGSGAEEASTPGPQRFVGGHRAALVDRLLATALNTEYFLSGLQEPRAAGGGGGGGGTSRTYGEEAEGPYAYDDDFISSSGFANSFGALDGSSSSSGDDEGEDESEGDRGQRAKKRGRRGRENEETVVTQGARATGGATDSAAAEGAVDAGAAGDGVDRGSESIAAGREGVLRLYGAVLLKFRTSVFLFCSAEASERGGENGGGGADGDGDGDDKSSAESSKHGPFELTLRRQGVMSAENLEAVAAHLQSLRRENGADGPARKRFGAASTPAATEEAAAAAAAAAAATGTRRRARDWMRVEVGRAALCGSGSGSAGGEEGGGGVAFSTRVAALLLTRSGERGGPPRAEKGGGGRRRPDGEEPGLVAGAGARAAAAAAEGQFGRDPWPEEDLPRASEQAARVFLPQGGRRGASGAASDARSGDRTPSSSPTSSTAADACRNAAAAAAAAAAAKKKKKREREGGDRFRVPPQYVGLLGQLPRDSRHLLERLGHQGYVKVLEDLLRGFLGVSNPASAAEAAEPAAAEVAVSPAAFSAPDAGVSGDTVDLTVSPRHDAGSDLGQDHLRDPWGALRTGRAHPSLSGLVEPPELASAGAERMVLPMPNPFYRRVLHALCRVHGLVSCGGDTRRRAEAGGDDGKGRTTTGYRTVEVTRGGGGGGSGGWGRLKRPGVRRGGVQGNVLTLVPVEILLAER